MLYIKENAKNVKPATVNIVTLRKDKIAIYVKKDIPCKIVNA